MTDDQASQKTTAPADAVRRRRSIAIALMLALMVVAFYVATFVRFSTVMMERAQ